MRITEQEYLQALEVVKCYKKQIEIETSFENLESIKIIGKTISQIKISNRLINILYRMYNINYDDRICFLKKDLSFFNDFDMKIFKKMRDCGKFTQTEMEYILEENNIPYFK